MAVKNKAFDCRETYVVSFMATRTRDPAAEKKTARRAVQKSMAGTRDSKAACFSASLVKDDVKAGSTCRGFPQFSLLPAR
jgi:hypothetical protein